MAVPKKRPKKKKGTSKKHWNKIKGRKFTSVQLARRMKRRQDNANKKKKNKKRKKSLSPKRKYPSTLSGGQRGDLRKEASDLARESYLPALQDIDRQLREVRRERTRDVSAQQHFGELGDERLAAAGQWLDQVLSRQAGVTQDIYQKAQQNVETAYAGARASNDQAAEYTQSGLKQSAEQLGLQEALTDPESLLKAEILATQAEVDGDYAEATGNLQTLGAEESARAQDTVGVGARQSAQDRSDLQTQVAGGIAGIQRQAAEQVAEGNYARRDIQSQRAVAQRNAYQQLRREDLDRKRQKWSDLLYQDVQRNTMKLQNAQLQLEKSTSKSNRKIARGQLGLAKRTQKQNQKLANKQFSFNKKMALRELRNRQAALRAEIAAANSPAARAKLQLELQKTQADINYTNARTAEQLAKASKYKSKKGKRASKKRWRSPVLPGPGERPGGR